MTKPPVWKHFAAFLYDLFPVIGILLLTSFIVLMIRNGQEVERHTLWFSALVTFEIAIYYIYSWKKGGQTLGMRAWKMKIQSASNENHTINWNQAIIRFIVGVVSTLLLGLGVFWKLSHSKSTWMDLITQTNTVVSEV